MQALKEDAPQQKARMQSPTRAAKRRGTPEKPCQEPANDVQVAEAPQIGGPPPSLPSMLHRKSSGSAAPPSAMITNSSQRDTQTRLLSSGTLRPGHEKDEYLLRLLGKGSKPPLPPNATNLSDGFRVPDPVPQRASQQPSSKPATAHDAMQAPATNDKPSVVPLGNAATASGQPNSETVPEWSYSQTQHRLGSEAADSFRTSVLAHQVLFLEQLYDLHRAIAVQKLLVRNCPEVRPLMAEAARILMSSSSGQQHRDITGVVPPAAKRQRLDNPEPLAIPRLHAAVIDPLDDPMLQDADGDPGLRPDSQFAAVPLPGETAATGDGSGDDGDGSGPNGSGGNGSGGGSNSPQPQLPLVVPHRRMMPPLQAAPSGASQTAMLYPRAQMVMPPPWTGMPPPMGGMGMPMPVQMAAPMGAMYVGNPGAAMDAQTAMAQHMAAQQQQQMAAAAAAAAAAGRAPPPGASPPQPAGAAAAAAAAAAAPSAPQAQAPTAPAGGAPPGVDPMAWWYQNYYGGRQQQGGPMGPPPPSQQQTQQMAATAAMAAFAGPQQPQRWWQDSLATFGPAADPQVVLAAAKAAGNAAGEAESAPPSVQAVAPPQPAKPAAAAPAPMVAPTTRPRRSKRKPSDPIEEASSGTTGQDHHLGPHAVTDDAHFKSRSPRGSRGIAPAAAAAAGVADASAAKLLLSFSGKKVV